MKELNALDWIALILLIIGGLNWGLVGFFDYDLISSIFSSVVVIARIIFAIVGLAAIYIAIASPSLTRK